MAYSKVDTQFITYLKDNVLQHLAVPYDEKSQNENAAQTMLHQATADNYGKISRIFDMLAKAPCVSLKEFQQGVQEAGNVESFLQPTINELANFLLVKDKSRVSDAVIKAIGPDVYAKLVGRDINSTEVAKNERVFAETMLEAILPCYFAAFQDNNLSPENEKRKTLEKTAALWQ